MQSLTCLLLAVEPSSNVIVENQLKCFWCSRKHVVSGVEDHILVENLYKFKGYRTELKIVNFLTKVGPLMVQYNNTIQ